MCFLAGVDDDLIPVTEPKQRPDWSCSGILGQNVMSLENADLSKNIFFGNSLVPANFSKITVILPLKTCLVF